MSAARTVYIAVHQRPVKRLDGIPLVGRQSGADVAYAEIFRQFEHAMLDMERQMGGLLSAIVEHHNDWDDLALFHGLALQRGPDRKLGIQSFGNTDQILQDLWDGWRKPFATWHRKEDSLRLRIEVPGVTKSDLGITVTPDSIQLSAEGDSQRYRNTWKPGEWLDADNVGARYKNGIVDLTVGVRRVSDPPRRVDLR